MIAFLKKFPLWVYIVVAIAIFFLWQSISGFTMTNKLWGMVKAEIVADEQRIIEELEKDNLQNVKDKETLYRQINQLQRQRDTLKNEMVGLNAENERLRHALENVVVPTDPDELVILLHELGLKSAIRRRSK